MLKQACSLAIRRVWNRRDIWSRCWDVAERWFQGWACDILETATRLFSFLAFKWLPLLVITALYENTWSIHSGFQVLHLETSHCLVSPCTLLPPCLLDCRLGGRKLQGRSIHCPEAFQAPPWTGKAPCGFTSSCLRAAAGANSSPSLHLQEVGDILGVREWRKHLEMQVSFRWAVTVHGLIPLHGFFLNGRWEEDAFAFTCVSMSIRHKEYFLKDVRLKHVLFSF